MLERREDMDFGWEVDGGGGPGILAARLIVDRRDREIQYDAIEMK